MLNLVEQRNKGAGGGRWEVEGEKPGPEHRRINKRFPWLALSFCVHVAGSWKLFNEMNFKRNLLYARNEMKSEVPQFI